MFKFNIYDSKVYRIEYMIRKN